MSKTDGCAIITGGSRGIGAACVRELASQGYDVVINYVSDRGAAKGQELLDEVKAEYGVDAILVQADVGDYQQCKKLVDAAVEKFGKIAVLVNNAGITHNCLFVDNDEETYRRLMDVNMFSAMHCCHLVLPYMIAENKGCIVIIGSTGGLQAGVGRVDYSVAKAGLIGLTRGLATEYAKNNIRVNYVAPGLINTDIITSPPEVIEQIVKMIPLGRMGEAKEMADAVGYMVNAEFLTGQVLAVNGGQFHH